MNKLEELTLLKEKMIELIGETNCFKMHCSSCPFGQLDGWDEVCEKLSNNC